MKIAKIFATGISGDIRSEFTVYNVKDVKTIKLTDQCKCYQFLGCEKGKAQAIYLHKTSDVFFRLIPDIEDIITIIEQEYSELSKAYQEKEKIYSSNPSIENKFEVEKAERLDTINTLILTPTGEEFKQAKLNLNHWKNYDNLSRAEYFNQSKIKALVAQVEKVKKW